LWRFTKLSWVHHHRACALSRHIQSSLQEEESWERCRNTWSGFWWEENSAEIERKQRDRERYACVRMWASASKYLSIQKLQDVGPSTPPPQQQQEFYVVKFLGYAQIKRSRVDKTWIIIIFGSTSWHERKRERGRMGRNADQAADENKEKLCKARATTVLRDSWCPGRAGPRRWMGGSCVEEGEVDRNKNHDARSLLQILFLFLFLGQFCDGAKVAMI
jgi:hypothetical protein